ncbi:hypothetical protein RQP46_010888 [Phenoliferia psychrophenolica]
MLIIKAQPAPTRSRGALPRLRPPQYPSNSGSGSALLPPLRPFIAPFLPQEIIDLIISFIRDERKYFIQEGDWDEAHDEEGDDLCLARCCLVARAFLAPARKALYTRIVLFNLDEVEGPTNLPPHLSALVETVVIEPHKDWVEWDPETLLDVILSPEGGYANVTRLELKLGNAATIAASQVLDALRMNDVPCAPLKTLRVHLPAARQGMAWAEGSWLPRSLQKALSCHPGLRSLTVSATGLADWTAEVPHLQLDELDLDLRTRPIEAFEGLIATPRPSLKSLTVRLGSDANLDWAAVPVTFPNLSTLRLLHSPPNPSAFFVAISTLPLTHLFILADLPQGCTLNPLPFLPPTLTTANVPLVAILDLVPFLESRQCPLLAYAEFYALSDSPELGCDPKLGRFTLGCFISFIISFILDDRPYFIEGGEYDYAPDEVGDDLCLARCCLVAKGFLAPARKALYTNIFLFNAAAVGGPTALPLHLAALVETVVIEPHKDWVEWDAAEHLRKILSPEGGYFNVTEVDLKLEKATGAAAIEILGSLHISDPPITRLETLRVTLPSEQKGVSRPQEIWLQITLGNALHSQPGLRFLTVSAAAQIDWTTDVPHRQLEEIDLDLRTRPLQAFKALISTPRPSLKSLTIRLGSHVALDWAAIPVAFPNLTTLRLTDCPPDPATFFLAISTLPLTHLFVINDLPPNCTFNPLPFLPSTLTTANVPLSAILDLVPFLESRQCPHLEYAEFYAVSGSPRLGCTPWSEMEVALAAQGSGYRLVQRSPDDDDVANGEVGEGEVEE